MKLQRLWQLGWRLAVCFLLLAWIFHAIFMNEAQIAVQDNRAAWDALPRVDKWQFAWTHGPQSLWNTLNHIHLGALILSLILMGLILLLGMLRWQLVLGVQGLDLSFKRTAQISMVAHFFNSFLLGAGGEVLKAYYAARETHHKKTEAVMTVLIDRLMGMFAMLLFGSCMLLFNLDWIFRHPSLRATVWLVLGMTLGCGLFLVLSFYSGLSKRIPQARPWLRRLPKGEMLERALESARQYGKNRAFLWKAAVISLALNVVCVLHFMVLIWGFGLKAPAVALAAIVPMVTSIASLPLTPSGLGVRENLYVFLLSVPEVGVPHAQALLVSLVGYGGSLVWSLIGGLVYLSLKSRQHLDEIQTAAREG